MAARGLNANSIEIHSVPLPLLRLDAYGRVRSVNLLAQDCMNRSESRLSGKLFSDLFAPKSEMQKLLKRAFEHGGDISDHGLTHRETRRPYTLHIGPDGEGLVVVMVPEGNRTEMEQQTKRHEMAEAVARIALEMAHEVKNPLAALRGATQWLSEQPLEHSQQEAAQMILAEVDRIRTRIDAFLQLGPRADVTMERVNIHTLLDDVCRPPESVILHRVYDPSLPEILAHPARLRQAIENLWANALDAGATNIEWQTRVAPTVRLPNHDGPVMEVRITNDGASIPEDLRERLFEPFVTGKQRGSGLGLAIVQRVLLEHGGRVQASSEQGRTAFILHLPIRGES